MQTFIQATPEEFIEMLRKVVREELSISSIPKSELKQFTKKEAAQEMRISLSTLERLIKSNRIPTMNIGKRIFIKEVDIQRFFNKKG